MNFETAVTDEVTMIDENTVARFLRALSGRTEDGLGKAVISYQSYAMEDAEDSEEKNRVYSLNNACVEFSLDRKNPGFFTLDIIFRSYDDPELKIFWSRLQKHKRNMALEGEKTWIFYINLLERESVTYQTETQDTLITANVFNPLIYYLTREVPNMLTTEKEMNRGEGVEELQGGNIIRMLIAEELVTFQVNSEIDTSNIKGEVMREYEEARYLNASDEL